MQKFNNILFLSKGVMDNNQSLDLSIRLAWRNKAKLAGLIVCPHLPSDMQEYQEHYEGSLLESLQSQINTSLSDHHLTNEDLDVPVELVTAEKPDIQAIRHIQKHKIDLVFKDAERSKNNAKGLRAIDMSLLRKCPCAVWLNRPSDKPSIKQRVAVAVNPNATSDEERALSIDLLKLSRSIADNCDSQLHIISCWEYVLESYLTDNVWFKASEQELESHISQAKKQHSEALQALVDAAEIGGDITLHRLHGTADDEIPTCVEEINVDVLVMGTLARTGIQGVMIGNTAENIVQNVDCSLVALKSKQFCSPIE
ncbi:universal stress protein family 1 [Vibrio orientalis CIP 102891 = ATCC 33934]|uniref:Universal stress protein family 1 n=1 Tax=Vibrio orientalis CIP 102891 = ATCC 33934 TaxID=675816 RepID=C9QE16_VIBOR|nr:universal stress protein [Vibrio orientalis]EEX94156.1 universal stress protein family 1 [Vibrio orientalis CIP 102891 = ATCC 33934]EGU44529.1 universal stress protein family 1 [Vibrio orientalis CIP 102891 = ATCC 33934]